MASISDISIRLKDLPILSKFRGRGGFSAYSTYRKFQTAWWQSLQLQTILDIGANAGQFGHACRLAFPKCRLYSFEPLEGPFSELSALADKDDLWEINNFAFGSADGETEIHADEYSPSSSILPMANSHQEHFPQTGRTISRTIKIRRLESFLSGMTLEKPALMKLDVQGYEAEVLKGAGAALAAIDYVICEVSYHQLYKNQPLFAEIHDLFSDQGFYFKGLFDQCASPKTGEILQGDAIFTRCEAIG